MNDDKHEQPFPPFGMPLLSWQTWGGVFGAGGLEQDAESYDFYSSLYNDHVSEEDKIPEAAGAAAKASPST